LLFTDDLLISTKGYGSSNEKINRILNLVEGTTGLAINREEQNVL